MGAGIKILISVVIGALVLTGVYTVQKNVVMQNATNKVEDLFSYNGGNTGGSIDVTDTPTYELRKLSPERVYPNDNMTITIGIPYSEFDYYTVDGEVASTINDYYLCDDGGYASFIAIPPYLNTLSKGRHTLRAYAKDGGFGEAIFYIE